MSITGVLIAALIVGGTGVFIGVSSLELQARNLQLK